MQNSHVYAKRDQASRRSDHVRFHPAVHLNTGDLVGAFVDIPLAYDDRPIFNLGGQQPSVADWMSGTVAELCRVAVGTEMRERPLILPIPAASLCHADTVNACADVLAGSRLCPQEICFEVTDAALVASPLDITALFRSFRQRGFRIAIDARTSWQADLRASTWLMVDTLRVSLNTCDDDDELMALIEVARSAGVAIIAEGALWRDGEYLASLGIEYALHPRSDA
ncbi:MAG: EAL domain-containing protein [Pseudomonadota bacterium]